MTKYWKFILTILLGLLIFLGWQVIDRWISGEETITSLEAALHSAGDNRQELEKVLRHYQKNPADSLKYKAACFLIENMPSYTYTVGEQLENYKTYFLSLKESKKTPEEISDSIKKAFGPIGKLERKYDIYEVDSAYLCHNIEWAFKVWKEQPWGKNVSFETFCEYLLPYRIDNEPLSYWREQYYKKYNSLLDSLKITDSLGVEDPVVVANYLLKNLPDLKYRYTGTTPISFGHIGPEYVQYLTGSCKEVTDFEVYLFRALGIPCAIDFVPARSTVNAGHFWLVVIDKNGEDYMSEFPSALGLVRNSWWFSWDETPKVYRSTFSVNRELYEKMAVFGEEVYPFWRVPKFIDVTQSYAYHYKKELLIPPSKLYKEKRDGKIAYLCISSRNNWVPIDWAEYDTDKLTFRNLKKGTTVRVATYEKGILHFVTDPFYVDKETNEICFYSVDKEKHDVVLYSKYNLNDEDVFRSRLLGGIFEGSDQPDFSTKDTLFIIQSKPKHLQTVVRSWSNKKYRYFRYVDYFYSSCNIAEVAFYECKDTTALKGRIIGTPGCYQNDGSHEYTNVFDGKTWTSFDYKESGGGWAGLDMGRQVQVERIMYAPRNRDNYIRPGDMFELFYCDREWKSAGIIRAAADSLKYCNIPKNALLYLRNHSRGESERIFVYKEGVQVWR